jgi:hypothetical protein
MNTRMTRTVCHYVSTIVTKKHLFDKALFGVIACKGVLLLCGTGFWVFFHVRHVIAV